MNKLRILAVALLLALAPVAVVTQTGCATNRTTEAKVFDSFKTTYNFAYHAYEGYLSLVVQGKVSKSDEQRADEAWNKFRKGFALSFQASAMDWSAATPAEVTLLANELNRLILSLL